MEPAIYYILDEHKNAVPVSFWEFTHSYDESINVNYTELLGGKVTVSTIFLGIDSRGFGVPLLFETVVVGGTRHNEQWFYETYEEARGGHERIVKQIIISCN